MHSKNRNIESVRALFLKKLLYILSFGIKPIFIFDGSPSELKHKVQKKRQDLKKIAEEKSLKANQELALQRAELQLLREIRNTSDSIDISNDEISVKKLKESNEDFIYPESSESSDHFGDDVEFIHHLNSLKQGNDELSIELLSRIDFTAEPFISLPLKFQHELVTYMKNCLYSLPLTLKDKSADDSGIKSDATNFSSSQLEKQIMHGKLRSLLLDIEKKIASQMLVDHSEQFIAFQNQIGNIETQRIASQENLHSIIIEISNKNVEDQKQSIDPMSNVKNEASNILQKSNEFNYGTETEFNKGDKYPITDKKASDCNISECKMISDSLEEIYDNAERFDASELSKKEENNYLYENRETESDHANTSNSVRLESVQKDTSLDISVSTDSNESFETVRNESDYGSKDESSKISSNSNNDIETESHEGLESIVNKSDNLDESRGQMVGLSLKDIDSQFFTSKSREDVTNGNMDDITEEKYAKRDDFEYLVDMSPTKQSKSVENYHILNIKQNHTLDSKKLPNIEFGSQINQSDIESIEKDNNIEQTVEMEESIPETSRYMRKVGLNSEIRSKEANLEDQINKTNELKKLVGFEYEDIYHAIKMKKIEEYYCDYYQSSKLLCEF
ncbi:MAG: nucleotide-excision repair, DNA incision, 3'-to lesion [Marteilia pararefringens]